MAQVSPSFNVSFQLITTNIKVSSSITKKELVALLYSITILVIFLGEIGSHVLCSSLKQ
jgi:hypothetical protein